eukprot:920948-Alexandrium_andersonii.AAC.1
MCGPPPRCQPVSSRMSRSARRQQTGTSVLDPLSMTAALFARLLREAPALPARVRGGGHAAHG